MVYPRPPTRKGTRVDCYIASVSQRGVELGGVVQAGMLVYLHGDDVDRDIDLYRFGARHHDVFASGEGYAQVGVRAATRPTGNIVASEKTH